MKTLVSILVCSTAVGLVAADAPLAKPPVPETRRLLQEGLFAEEVDRDLDRAAKAYEAAVAAHAAERGLAATALMRLAELRAKKGDQARASVLLQRLVREFPEQEALVKVANERLASAAAGLTAVRTEAIAPGALATPTTAEAQELSPEERTALAKAQGMVANSPDLLNAEQHGGQTPLESAAENGHLQLAAYLLEHGAHVNGRGGPWLPLHLAAMRGHKRMVELLLAKGGDVNAAGRGGWTALHAAVRHRRVEVARLLLEKGAKPNAEVTALALEDFQSEERTPLMLAICERDERLARLLLDHAADPKQPDSIYGVTPLILAVKQDAQPIATLLLERGADVHAASRLRETPLLAACSNGNVALAKLLIGKGANVTAADQLGRTPLHYAVKLSAELVHVLLAAGAPADATDQDGRTPLHHLMWSPSVQLATGGRERDPVVPTNTVPPPFKPEITQELARVMIEIAEALVAKGAQIDRRAKETTNGTRKLGRIEGDTPLWNAATNDRVPEDVVAWFVERGADLEVKAGDGYGALERVPNERSISLERRLLIPKYTGRPAVTMFVRSMANNTAKPPRSVMQLAEFDAPPSFAELLDEAYAYDLIATERVTGFVYRRTAEQPAAEAHRVALSLSNFREVDPAKEDVPLAWGDIVEIMQVPNANPDGWTKLHDSAELFLKATVARQLFVFVNGRPIEPIWLSPRLPAFTHLSDNAGLMYWDIEFPGITPAKPARISASTPSLRRSRPVAPVLPSPFRALSLLQARSISLRSLIELTITRTGEEPRTFDAATLEKVNPWLMQGDKVEIRSL